MGDIILTFCQTISHLHTSEKCRTISKERQRVQGWGKSAKKCDIILTLLCQTIPHSLPFPYPDYLSARFPLIFFSAHADFFLLLLPVRSLVLGYWDFDSFILHSQCLPYLFKLSCMSGQTLYIYFPGEARRSKEVSVCFSIVVKVAFLPLYFWKDTAYTVNSLLTDASIRRTTGVDFYRFFCYFSSSVLSQDTHPFKTDNGHLRSALFSENTSKIPQNSIP